MRSLSYCRIIDYIKYFELTQCFSSQHLLVFCYKGQVLLVPLQIENLGKKGEYIIYLGFLSNVTTRLASSRLDTFFFNVLKRMLQARDLFLHFFWMKGSSMQVLVLYVLGTKWDCSQSPAGYSTCNFPEQCPVFVQFYMVILMIEAQCYRREDFTCLP